MLKRTLTPSTVGSWLEGSCFEPVPPDSLVVRIYRRLLVTIDDRRGMSFEALIKLDERTSNVSPWQVYAYILLTDVGGSPLSCR